MKLHLLFSIFFVLSALAAENALVTPGGEPAKVSLPVIAWEEHFEGIASPAEFFAKRWNNYKKMSAEQIQKVYHLTQGPEGGFLSALHNAKVHEGSVHLGYFFLKSKFKLREYPILTWRWRVKQYPQVAAAASPISDCPATVYVVFKKEIFRLLGAKFSWSAKKGIKPGFYKKERLGMVFHILRTAESPKDTWLTERIDLCEVYKAAYKEKSCDTEIEYIGVLTDADDSKSLSAADYDDFQWLRP